MSKISSVTSQSILCNHHSHSHSSSPSSSSDFRYDYYLIMNNSKSRYSDSFERLFSLKGSRCGMGGGGAVRGRGRGFWGSFLR